MSHDCNAQCTAGWVGGRKCHCASCGENFSTPVNFDKHRDDKCIPPAKVGLVQNDRGVWVQPGETDFFERLSGAKATA